MRIVSAVFAAAAVTLALAGCADDAQVVYPAAGPSLDQQVQQRAALLLRYDTDQNGDVTRAELDAGLSADFAAADTDQDGGLNGAERRLVNEQRVAQGGQESPLIDWNADGVVDATEFSNVPRTMFDKLDRDDDGVVSRSEFGGIRFEAPRNNKAPTLAPPTQHTPQGASGPFPGS